jgi:hypothetical protein
MVVVLERNETEGLQDTIVHFPRGRENFGHAVHGTSLCLKSNFDKVALSQRMGHLQQAASHGNGLEFGFGAPAVFEADRSQDRIS